MGKPQIFMGINGRNWKAKSQKWQAKTHEQFAIIIAKARDKWKHTIGSKYNLEREYQMTKGKIGRNKIQKHTKNAPNNLARRIIWK